MAGSDRRLDRAPRRSGRPAGLVAPDTVRGGGNDSKGYRSTDLRKLDAAGHFTKLRETPLPIGVTGTIFTVDPASGNNSPLPPAADGH